MSRVKGIKGLSKYTGLPRNKLIGTFTKYQEDAAAGEDGFGKTTFRGVPGQDLESEVFYVGRVTPVLHYCMGGITIDVEGSVLTEDGKIIPGLHAAGEVTGGVHGGNRLAGNSLLECTVFGSIVGQKIPVKASRKDSAASATKDEKVAARSKDQLRTITLSEVRQHNTPDDCWVAIHGFVYDLTEFAVEHPAGAQSIYELAGKDGSDAFTAVHSQGILDDFEEDRIGILASS
jgi:predicted heme/steroid binding protein